MAGQKSSSGDIWQVLASKQEPNKNKKRHVNEGTSAPSTATINGTTYYLHKGKTINFQWHQYSVHMTKVHYHVGQHDVAEMEYALVDRWANGGICGSDMKILGGSERFVDVVGLTDRRVSQLHIVTAQALMTTHKGDVIATFHQMALLGKGKSILSCLQMEAHGADINNRSHLFSGGKQHILMDGYQFPLDFKNGIPYLWCQMPTENEIASLPHIVMTSDVDWDPSTYDKDIDNLDDFHDPSEDDHENYHFYQYGEYRHWTIPVLKKNLWHMWVS
jgi:hypothetical protein